MKRRTFYIINLDRNRLFILTVLFVGLLAAAYATGFRLGRTQGPSAGVEALSYQDLMGLPDEENAAGGLAPGELPPSDLSELPDEHPLRQNPAGDSSAVANSGIPAVQGAAGELDRQPGAALAPTPLPRLSEPETSRVQGRKEQRTDRRREQKERERIAARKKARAQARAEEKRRKRAEARARKERERRIAREREKKRKAQVAASLPGERRTIGQTVGPASRDRFQNTGRSRLSFEKRNAGQKPGTAGKQTAARERNRTTADTARSTRDKRTVSLRNVSPSTRKPEAGSRKRGEREYSLQLGSFSSRDSAFRMASSLKRQGFNPYVYRSGGKFAVRVGKTDRPGHLETLEQRLRRKRYSPMRISYKKPKR